MFKGLSKMVLPRGGDLIITVLVGALASLSTVGLMGLAGWLVAAAALQPPMYTLTLAITGVRLAGISRAVLRYGERYLSHKVGFAFFNDFRQGIITQMAKLVPFKMAEDAGSIYDDIVNAVDRLRDAILRFCLPPITALICGLSIALVLGIYEISLGGYILLITIVLLGILPWWANRAYEKLPQGNYQLTQEILEMYAGDVEIAIYGYGAKKLAIAQQRVEAYQRDKQVENRLKAKINLVTESLASLSMVGGIALVLYLYSQGLISGVGGVAVILTVQALLDLYQGIPALAEWVQQSRLAYNVLNKYQNGEETTVVEDLPLSTGYLQSRDLSFGYGEMVLEKLNLKVEPGDKVLLLGPSGVGKSTMFYVLTKLLKYSKGSLAFRDKGYGDWQDEALRRHFAPAFQEHHLFAGTVRENFQLLHPQIQDEEILKALKQVGSRIFTTMEDLDFKLWENGSNISGGQRQGLILAMVLARAEDVILLDEPTAGLDLKTAGHLLQNLLAEYQDHTVLISSHDLSVVKYFQKVVILGNNTILEQGEIKELLQAENSLLRKMMVNQNVL